MDIEPKFPEVGQVLAGDDPGRFLSAVLEGMETVVGLDGRLRMAVDPEDSAVAAGLAF